MVKRVIQDKRTHQFLTASRGWTLKREEALSFESIDAKSIRLEERTLGFYMPEHPVDV